MPWDISPLIRLRGVGSLARFPPEVQLVNRLVILTNGTCLRQVVQILIKSQIAILVLEEDFQGNWAITQRIRQSPIGPRKGATDVAAIFIFDRIGIFPTFVVVHRSTIGRIYTGIFMGVVKANRFSNNQVSPDAVQTII